MDFLSEFGWIFGGIVVGAIVWALRKWSADVAKGLADQLYRLGAALMPVGLPVLVVLTYAATGSSWPVQVIVGALLAGCVLAVFFGRTSLRFDRPQGVLALTNSLRQAPEAEPGAGSHSETAIEMRERTRAVTDRSRRAAKLVISLCVVALVASIPVVSMVRGAGSADWQDSVGMWAGLLIWAAAPLVVIALVFRLFGYSISWPRAVVAAILGVLLFASFTASGWKIVNTPWLLVITALTVLILMGVESVLVRRTPEGRRVPTVIHRVFRVFGFYVGALAALTLLVGTLIGWRQTTDGVDEIVFKRAVSTVAVPNRPSSHSKLAGRALIDRFSPMLRLTHDEKYPPTRADNYAARSPGCETARGFDCKLVGCPTCREPVSKPWNKKDVVFYARLLTSENAPAAVAGWVPGDRSLKTLIQYWIFYDYDLWEAPTVLGTLVQEHDADWEFVAVGLDASNDPIFLALSAHCGGQVVPWDDSIAALPGRTVDGRVVIYTPGQASKLTLGERGVPPRATHPLVAVARGSHANYADDGSRRPPDWGSCLDVNTAALNPIVYGSNVRDVTAPNDDSDASRSEFVQAWDIEPVDEGDFPMNVPGPWGRENITLGVRKIREGHAGPGTPPTQPTWSGLVRRFFCNRFWHPYERPPKALC